MHDIKEQFRYDSGSIDLVHARSITMAVRVPVLPPRPSSLFPRTH